MKTLHKIVLALVSSFANGTSNPAPQGNRALEKINALTHGPSPRPKQETRNPETPQKRPLFQKVKEVWMNPKETATTIGVGMTYGIVIGALLLLPFPPKSIQAQSTSEPLPLPAVPVVYEVHVTGLMPNRVNQIELGFFDISIVTDNQQWTSYKYCWSGFYFLPGWGPIYRDATTSEYHGRYVSYNNYWNDQYLWVNDSSYSCRIVAHGDNKHVRDTPTPEVYADVEFYLEWNGKGKHRAVNPAAIVTDTNGNRYRVPVFLDGVSYTTW